MARPVFLGQAPSRVGDGRPFSGPSGRRLCALLGMDHYDYDYLASVMDLQNLLPTPAEKVSGKRTSKGDLFDRKAARSNWTLYAESLPDDVSVICAGRQVWRTVTLRNDLSFFDTVRVPAGRGTALAHFFPHPSGISHFWNDARNVSQASDYLLAVIARVQDL